MSKFDAEAYLDYFEQHIEKDGDIELDRNIDRFDKRVSLSDEGGAYILCWKWVDDADIAAS